MGLGSFGNVTLEQARAKAVKLRNLLSTGLDPIMERRREDQERLLANAKLMTFKQCAEAYINAHRAEWKNPKHIQQWENTLDQYCYPIIGSLSITDIDRVLVKKCLDPIWETKNETASRLRGRIERVLSWATVSEYRTGDNPARWRGNLDALLAKPSKVQKTEHHSALPYSEINAFIALLRQQAGIAAKCLEFTILTAVRTGEAIGATWDEIDLNTKIWTIPKSRMKADREHRVPLSNRALTLLNDMVAIRFNDYVFPSNKKGLSNMAMLTLLRRMDRADITVHGFRSTFRDWAAETEKHYPNEILEMCLAHGIKSEAEAAYRRGDLMAKRFIIMNDWAEFCS